MMGNSRDLVIDANEDGIDFLSKSYSSYLPNLNAVVYFASPLQAGLTPIAGLATMLCVRCKSPA